MAHYKIDEVKLRVVDLLGDDFSNYSAEDIAELEVALRTDDPEEFERIYARWRERGPLPVKEKKPLPDCLDCRWPMRFGYPPQCKKHPWTGEVYNESDYDWD